MVGAKSKKALKREKIKQDNLDTIMRDVGRSDLTGEVYYHKGPKYGHDVWTRFTMTPVIPLTAYGSKNPVEQHHLWKLKADLSTENSWRTFEPHWEAEKLKENPSLITAIAKSFGNLFLLSLLLNFVFSASQYALPLLIPYMIEWFLFSTLLPYWWIYVYSVAIFCASTCGSLFNWHSQLITYKFGLKLRNAVTTMIYRKALYTLLGRTQTSGMVVNLMSSDAQLVLETLPMFMQGILAPIQIAVTLGLMSRELGPYCLISLAVAVLAMPLTGWVASKMASLRFVIQQRSDVRLKFIKEFLTAIRIVKYYAWEVPFVKNIAATRAYQLIKTKGMLYCRAFLISILTNVPGIGIGLTFFFYGIKNTMNFNAVFSAMAYLNMLRIPFIFTPILLSFVGQYVASFDRIAFFALRSELKPRLPDEDIDGIGGMIIKNGDFAWETELSIAESRVMDLQKSIAGLEKAIGTSEDAAKIDELKKNLATATTELGIMKRHLRILQRKIQEETFGDVAPATEKQLAARLKEKTEVETEMTKYAPLRAPVNTLTGVDLKVSKEKLTCIVGSVGSGKSTLALAFLGEVKCTAGQVFVFDQVSYAAQEAWILNATIRDNICFGKEYDPEWYSEVIRACALTTDLSMFPASDLTEIGERGTNLSGGQRQRINVARAMYSKSPIVILDDPFSAVDAHVGDHMFTHVAKAMSQAGRTVLLVTNQLHFLPEADHIGVLKKGQLVEQGSYADLMGRKSVLSKMLAKQAAAAQNNVTVTDAERNEAEKAREAMKAAKNIEFVLTPEKDEEFKRAGALIKMEERESGNIGPEVYWAYVRAGGILLMSIILFCQVIRTGSRVMGGIYLSWWSDPTNSHHLSKGAYLGGYLAFVAGEGVFTLFGSLGMVFFAISAGRSLHEKLTNSVSRATTGWFDVTPIGRIVARFSKDIDFLDVQLPQLVEQSINFFFIVVGVLASVATGTPYILILIAIGAILFAIMTMYYRRTSIQVQRLEALSRAPIFSHFTETLEGAITIRAFNMAEAFKTANMNKIDCNTVAFVSLRYCSAWFALTLDMLGNTFTLCSYIAIILVRKYAPNSINVGYMIFAIANTGGISQSLSAFSNAITDLENKMNSAERIMQYFHLPEEAPYEIPENKPPAEWPADGAIEIDDLSVEYKAGQPVLRHLNCHVKAGEKIGIVGRTGAGKSTLITALFRTIEPVTGTIKIDGVDITKIGLFDLRSRLSIIPQTPQLFVGSVRYNLDPFDEHSDDDLWKVLKMVELSDHVKSMDGDLSALVDEGGSNFSVGQRQLLSMARCLLRGTHVLLLDEATAAVDVETDSLLQRMIRKHFADKTVLTIAHRLNTIMDSDRIMVLDAGQIVEYDSPKKLLSNRKGVLYGMVEATGPDTASYLRAIANGQISVADALEEDLKASKSDGLNKSTASLLKGSRDDLKSSRDDMKSSRDNLPPLKSKKDGSKDKLKEKSEPAHSPESSSSEAEAEPRPKKKKSEAEAEPRPKKKKKRTSK